VTERVIDAMSFFIHLVCFFVMHTSRDKITTVHLPEYCSKCHKNTPHPKERRKIRDAVQKRAEQK